MFVDWFCWCWFFMERSNVKITFISRMKHYGFIDESWGLSLQFLWLNSFLDYTQSNNVKRMNLQSPGWFRVDINFNGSKESHSSITDMTTKHRLSVLYNVFMVCYHHRCIFPLYSESTMLRQRILQFLSIKLNKFNQVRSHIVAHRLFYFVNIVQMH